MWNNYWDNTLIFPAFWRKLYTSSITMTYTNDVKDLCVFICYFYNKMKGDVAHGITEVVKGVLLPQFWLCNCVHLWVLYQLDIFLSFLKFIYSIDCISSMWFLFVACIFKLQGQRFFKFQRHQVCEDSGIMDLNYFFSGQNPYSRTKGSYSESHSTLPCASCI